MQRLLRYAPALAIALTVIAALVVPRLRLSGDLARLFPDDPPARALGAYVRAFGGGDVTTILVRGDDPREVSLAADELVTALSGRPGVRRATTTLAPPHPDPDAPPPDPTLAWAFADDEAKRALDQAMTDDGMRARLDETYAMLLVPGGGSASTYLTHDPLRLLGIVRTRARSVAATIGSDESGDLVADGGRARFVLVTTEGSALRSSEARRVVVALEGAIAEVLPRHPGVRAGIAGGAAIARDAEKMIRSDLYLSSALSTLLVAVAFVVTFRRSRALLAIGPPLLIGTLWTAAIAALFPDGIAAIAMGFASVVIGVGLDTGVHVYAAVMRARQTRTGTTKEDLAAIADEARAKVARPTLTAAFAAAFAFGALALSRLPALRQLGLLCALGEVLTAVAILALTPAIAARLEKTATPMSPPRLVEAVSRLSSARWGARAIAGVIALCAIALIVFGPPRPAAAIVAMKPRGLPALQAQEGAIRLASGTRASIDVASDPSGNGEVQLVVIQRSHDEAELLARGERLADALSRSAEARTIEALASWVPSPARIAARLAERDRLDLPARAIALENELKARGFAIEPFAPSLTHLRSPATPSDALAAETKLRDGALAPLFARHLARDETDGSLLLATYVRGPGLSADALAIDVARVDPEAVVTGYPVLERSLRAALAADLPRVALVALVLVAIALRTVLRRFRDVLVALIALAAELLLVALLVRVLGIPLHVYDALVLPVLIGITVDESMFLLHAMREGDVEGAVRREGRAIVATATTTAAGFAALLTCHFPGLRDLGAIGVVGTFAGLIASLLVVPAAARALGVGKPEAARG